MASDREVLVLFGHVTNSEAARTKREVARIVGERLGMTAKQVYEIVERYKLVEQPK
jgi:hypothetical protein